MGEWQVEDKHQMMADKEATRMNRLISSIEDHTVSEKGDYSSEHDEHLTPEQREEARLNKRWITDAPKVSYGLPHAPTTGYSPTKHDDTSPRKGAIVITRPSYKPKGSAEKEMEVSGETESEMLARRLREAKAKAYKKEKDEKERSVWKEKEKERAKQVELQLKAKREKELEDRVKVKKEVDIRKAQEQADLEERARLEQTRFNDPDAEAPASVGGPSGVPKGFNPNDKFEVKLTEEEEIEAAKKEEARMKAHFLL